LIWQKNIDFLTHSIKRKSWRGKYISMHLYEEILNTLFGQPETTSLARAKGFNRDNVLQFPDLLESSIAKFGFTFDKIFNVDESGFSTVQKRPQETVAAVLLPADTAQSSYSETQNPETSLGTESDSEDSNDSSNDGDYKPFGKRMRHFVKTLEQISPLTKPSVDPRPTLSRRSHGREKKATVLTSSRYKRALERSKDKGKKKSEMKIQLSQATDGDANDGDSSWFGFLCAKSSKGDMIQCLQCRSWVHIPCVKVKPSIKKYCCSTCTARYILPDSQLYATRMSNVNFVTNKQTTWP
jgi:hypothetical protein